MYVPSAFEMKDREDLFEWIRKYSFAVLFSQTDGMPVATHLPLLPNEKEGFKIRITRMEGKVKLSQNESKERQAGVIDALNKHTSYSFRAT